MRDLMRLSARERQVVIMVASGASNKEIAYDLSIDASTVGTHLSSAVRQLRCESRLELIRRYSSASGVQPTQCAIEGERMEALSASLRDVLSRCLSGSTVAQIAAARGTRPGTVRKQIQIIYRRFDVSSRAELTARLHGQWPLVGEDAVMHT